MQKWKPSPYQSTDHPTLISEWRTFWRRLEAVLSVLQVGDFLVCSIPEKGRRREGYPYVQVLRTNKKYHIEIVANRVLQSAGRVPWQTPQLRFIAQQGFDISTARREMNYVTKVETAGRAADIVGKIYRNCLMLKTPWQIEITTGLDDVMTYVCRSARLLEKITAAQDDCEKQHNTKKKSTKQSKASEESMRRAASNFAFVIALSEEMVDAKKQ